MTGILIEIHKAKDIISLLSELAQIISSMTLSEEFENQLLNKIKDIKSILQEAVLK